MSQKWYVPARLKLITRAAIFYFFLFVLLRIAFYFVFSKTAQDFRSEDLVKAFQIGLSFDLRLALAILLPLATLGWIPWLSPERVGPRRFWLAYLTVVTAVVGVFFALDFGFYAYLNGRLNATILKFAENPLISAEMVWQTYPVVWITLACYTVSALAGRPALTQKVKRRDVGFSNPKEICKIWVIALNEFHVKVRSS